jgi:hypothetical protein
LQAIRCPQGMLIQQHRCQITKLIDGKNFPPSTAQQTQACHCTLFIEIGYLPGPMEEANSAVNLHETSPPNNGRESPQMGLSEATRGFVNTQRN